MLIVDELPVKERGIIELWKTHGNTDPTSETLQTRTQGGLR